MAKKRFNHTSGSTRAAILAMQREADAVRLRLEGASLEEIAAQLGYASRSGARLAIIRAKARLTPIENADELRRQEVARTYEIEQEAMEQWYRSIEDAVQEKTRSAAVQVEGEGEEEPSEAIKIETTVTREGQSGNPGLLHKALLAMERRAQLLGLDAPKRLDVNGGVRVIGKDRVSILQAALKAAKEAKKNVDD